MATWQLIPSTKKIPTLHKPILLEGLPGIGNVGKVAVDFIKDELGAVKLFDVFSNTFPHSVFVNEKNLIELPSIEMYYKAFNDKKKNDLIFLVGDVQPIDEVSSYDFCDTILDFLGEQNGVELITIGGIGLQTIPKKPKVYCTANELPIIKRYKEGTQVSDKLYGVVGPIVGVSGLLPGLAGKRKIPSIIFLAETFGHPMYLGIKGAREVVKILTKKLQLPMDLKKLDHEIEQIESELLKKTDELSNVSKQTALKRMEGKLRKDVNYIG